MGEEPNDGGEDGSARPADDWDGGWEAHRIAQSDAWGRATPAQRLAWLEEAIELARPHRSASS